MTTIYAVRDGDDGPVKIGKASNLGRRIGDLQTGNPRPLKVVAAAEGEDADEAALHSLCRPLVVRSEWFHPEVMRFLSVLGLLDDAGDFHMPNLRWARAQAESYRGADNPILGVILWEIAKRDRSRKSAGTDQQLALFEAAA